MCVGKREKEKNFNLLKVMILFLKLSKFGNSFSLPPAPPPLTPLKYQFKFNLDVFQSFLTQVNTCRVSSLQILHTVMKVITKEMTLYIFELNCFRLTQVLTNFECENQFHQR